MGGNDPFVKEWQKSTREILSRLGRIEGMQEIVFKQCEPRREKLDDVETIATQAMESTKAAHHRIDGMQMDRAELKKDLTELKKDLKESIKEEVAGVYRTAIIIGGVVSFFVGIMMRVVMK